MDIQNAGFLSIEQLTDRYLTGQKASGSTNAAEGLSFQEVFRQKAGQQISGTDTLKFSKHASGRLEDRGIRLSDNQMERLHDGVRRAEQKGIKDSLVIVDSLAFIVNIPNNTVVTAMDSTQANDNVFTNINGAVIM